MIGILLWFLVIIAAMCLGALLYAAGIIPPRWIRRKPQKAEPIDFREMLEPPDQGIEQRIYKPKGSPAVIHKNAVGKHSKKRK